jgi:hypothetical protein
MKGGHVVFCEDKEPIWKSPDLRSKLNLLARARAKLKIHVSKKLWTRRAKQTHPLWCGDAAERGPWLLQPGEAQM